MIKIISFACKQIELKDLVMCSFELNKTDYRLFMFMLGKDQYLTTSEIADLMGLDRSSVQKSIKRLTEKNLVLRKQQNLDKGGYIFSYMIKDKKDIKDQMLSMINNWKSMVEKEINNW
ncbi:MAG: MarR family transcriptional regulator [Nanobdellota archaeon]